MLSSLLLSPAYQSNGPLFWNCIQERRPFNSKLKKKKKATSMSSGSCSLWTCIFTRRPTWARSPTAVVSAPRSLPTPPRCTLSRGPTPRSLSAVSTVTELSTTVGTSVFTLWARALRVPRVSPAFRSILIDWPRTLPLTPSPFCSKKEIHNDESLL